MNTDTNKLMDLTDEEKESFLGGVELQEVPPELNRAAKRKLAGKKEAQVSFTSGGKLSRWAAKERKKRKAAKKSRQTNR